MLKEVYLLLLINWLVQAENYSQLFPKLGSLLNSKFLEQPNTYEQLASYYVQSL